MGAVYLTGVLEYLTAEIMELAGNAAFEVKKKRITPRHVMLAVQYDQEMFTLFDDGKVIMPGTGVASFIHKELLPKNPIADEPVGKKPKSAAKESQHEDTADSTTSLLSPGPSFNPPQSPKSCHSQEY